jgi:hypothetical protein
MMFLPSFSLRPTAAESRPHYLCSTPFLGSFEGMEEAEEERGGVRASKNGEAGWWSRQRTLCVRWTRFSRMCRLRREVSTRRSHKVCVVAREG